MEMEEGGRKERRNEGKRRKREMKKKEKRQKKEGKVQWLVQRGAHPSRLSVKCCIFILLEKTIPKQYTVRFEKIY